MTAPADLPHARTPAPPPEPAPDWHHILDGRAMRRARRRAGLTLEAAAGRIGRTASVISRYERDLVDVPASVLTAMARQYRVHPGDFFRPGR